MPLTLRPHSANNFALSKVWFKCSSLNLRQQDISTINTKVKSWLYQDCLEKPSELTLYRDTKDGGLGLFNVKMRALACLIRSFLETAANPTFRHHLYHEILYRFHVLGEVSLPDPGLPPYYDQQFFDTIRHYHQASPLNIAVMSIKQWYAVLLEDRVLMSPATDNTPPLLLPVRAEMLSPSIDWPATWNLTRIRGLGSELSSFLFKLLHCLLPSQDRVARIGVSDGQVPGLCLICQLETEDLVHAFFTCSQSRVVGLCLLGWVQGLCPDLSPEGAVQLQLGGGLDGDEELAAVYLLASGMKYIWESRKMKKKITLHQMRSEVEAIISILRKTRHGNAALRMMEMLEN